MTTETFTKQTLAATIRAEVKRRAAGVPAAPGPQAALRLSPPPPTAWRAPFSALIPPVVASPPPLSDRQHYQAQEFFVFDDVDFVEEIYQRLLGRRPDASGLDHYVTNLRLGASKVDLLLTFCRSEECRARGIVVTGLKRHALLRRIYRLPLVGRGIKVLVRMLQLPAIVRHLHSLEARTAWQMREHKRFVAGTVEQMSQQLVLFGETLETHQNDALNAQRNDIVCWTAKEDGLREVRLAQVQAQLAFLTSEHARLTQNVEHLTALLLAERTERKVAISDLVAGRPGT